MIEATKKKATFLSQVNKLLGYEDCHVIPERAEDAAHNDYWREKSDYVVARALGSLSISLELTCPLAKVGGMVVLQRGSREDEFEQSSAEKQLGCSLEQEIKYVLPGRDKPYRLLIYKKIKSTDGKYPRNTGHIKKRPL